MGMEAGQSISNLEATEAPSDRAAGMAGAAEGADGGRANVLAEAEREREARGLSEDARPLLSRRPFLLGVSAIAVLLTWCAWWCILFASYTGIVVSHDLRVVRILSDGPAARSGIEPGDRVVAVDGKRIASLTDYLAVMKDPGLEGREVEIVVSRAGKEIALPVGVAAYPAIHRTVFGPILGALVLVFGLYVHLRKPRDPAAGLYLLLSVCLFVVLALRCHPGYLALHSP